MRIISRESDLEMMVSNLTKPFFSAKGLSSFGAGQLVGQNILTINGMFQAASLYTACAATIFYVIYWVIGRKLELNLVTKIEQEKQQIQEQKPQIERRLETYVPGLQILDSIVVTSL